MPQQSGPSPAVVAASTGLALTAAGAGVLALAILDVRLGVFDDRGPLVDAGVLLCTAGVALVVGTLAGRGTRRPRRVVPVTVGIDPETRLWAAAIPTGSRRPVVLGPVADPAGRISANLVNACDASPRDRRSLPKARLKGWCPLASALVSGPVDAHRLASAALDTYRAAGSGSAR